MPSGELLLQTTHFSMSSSSDTNSSSLDWTDVFSFELFIPLVLGFGEELMFLPLLGFIHWIRVFCYFAF